MNLQRLEYFVAIVNAGSVSRASVILDMSQPALSRQLALLEEEVGHRLLTRHGRGVEPTDAGQALMVHALDLFEGVARARADMRELHLSPRGRLTIGLPPRVAHTITSDLVQSFRKTFPDAAIRISEGLSASLREWLIAGRLDIAILFDPPHSPQLMIENLLREDLFLISARPLPEKIKLAEVAQYDLIMPSGKHALRQLFEQEAQLRGLSLRVVAEVDSVQSVLPLVARGVANTVLPISALKSWPGKTPPYVARIYAPHIKNKFTVAVPTARPSTQLTRFGLQLLKKLVHQHYG
jgi:LysR family nitrogen assimilation transcriptional regulator